jgi:protein arginine N-methyltransferase 1
VRLSLSSFCRSYSDSSHRQTVFYTPGTSLRVAQGEEIKGTLTCAPNNRNNRDLDISITYGTESSGETRFDYKMCVLPSVSLLGH